ESCIADVPGIGPLRCYSDPKLGIFYNGNIPCDTITTFPVSSSDISANYHFKIYPNPVTDYLSIDYDGNGNINIEIYNANGNIVVKKEFCPKDHINMASLPSGIYFINIINYHNYNYNDIIIKK
ncbi:MAG TPA: T9SS type A sorting domain-containing protein, partial [Sunxiuqinia sp.]|nr:T9SS type A sorting domain-containing protein [Sunxiuqinia sp.]